MRPSTRIGYLLAVCAAVIWSGTGPGISYLLEAHSVPPLVLAFWRDALIAVTCLAGIGLVAAMGRRGLPKLSGADLRGFALMGAISVGLYHALFVYSIGLNGAALGIVLIYLYPAFVTLGARLLFKEQIGPMQLVSLALALVGCVLLVGAYDPAVLQVSWLGVLVGVASAVTHAGYVLFNQRAVTRHSPWVSLALTMFFGALVLLGLTLAVLGPASLLAVGNEPTPWLVLVALALGPTLGGYALFTFSLRHIPGRIASLIVVIEAPITILAAVLLLGEQIEPAQAVGMALIMLAAVLPGLPFQFQRRARVASSAN